MEKEIEKAYSFRKLNASDLFLLTSIISKIGITELTDAFDGDIVKNITAKSKGVKGKDTQLMVGVNVAFKMANIILAHMKNCENEIFELLSSVTSITVAELRNLDMDIFFEMLVDFVMKKEFKSFFKVASKYIKA